MDLIYKDKSIKCTRTYEQKPMKYRYEKLYFGIIINDCNRYSSLNSLQYTDVCLVDEDYKILELKKNMHPNTYIECDEAVMAIITPKDYFDIEKDKYFKIN